MIDTQLPSIKILISEKPKDDSVIIHDNIMYIGKVSREEIQGMLDAPVKFGHLFSVPLNYMKRLLFDFDHVVVEYGHDSETEIHSSDKNLHDELKEIIKTVYPNSTIEKSDETIMIKGKKPLIAMLVIVVLYVIVLIQDTSNNGSVIQTRGLFDLLRALSSLGPFVVSMIFLGLFLIAYSAFYRKTRNKDEITILEIR